MKKTRSPPIKQLKLNTHVRAIHLLICPFLIQKSIERIDYYEIFIIRSEQNIRK